MFARYQQYFVNLDLGDLSQWDGDVGDGGDVEGCETWFTYQARQVLHFADQLNQTEEWIREDYQEMAELLIVFFHGRVSSVVANGLFNSRN